MDYPRFIQDLSKIRAEGNIRVKAFGLHPGGEKMNTVKQASKALANAYKLKNYPVSGIYIAKDMTYHQRLKMRELVKTLRYRIEMLPKYRWKIVDWEVVNVGRFKKQEQDFKHDLMNSYSGSLDSISSGPL